MENIGELVAEIEFKYPMARAFVSELNEASKLALRLEVERELALKTEDIENTSKSRSTLLSYLLALALPSHCFD